MQQSRLRSDGPCAGYRVLDFSSVISGPFCSQILGDLGADVVKVEPPRGDVSRFLGPSRSGGLSGFFAQFNRNKRSVVVDLKNDGAGQVISRLCKDVDVVVHNFRPGVAERVGIGERELRRENPNLVYVSITGFGSDGPYASLPAYDMIIQGLCGMMPIQGGVGRAPRLIQSFVADKCTAMTAASAVVAGLLARERGDGMGQRIDVPMLNAYAAFALPDLIMGESFQPVSSQPTVTPDIFRTWETSDGYVVGIVLEDHQFEGICRAIERVDLLTDDRFNSIPARMKNADFFFDVLENEIRSRTTEAIVHGARKHGAPFGEVNDLNDFFNDPQVKYNGVFLDVEIAENERLRYLDHPVVFSETPASIRRPPPRLAQHTDQVLSEVGCDPAMVREWRSSGVIA